MRESIWEKSMTLFVKPFISAEVRYFDYKDSATASDWVNEPVSVAVA